MYRAVFFSSVFSSPSSHDPGDIERAKLGPGRIIARSLFIRAFLEWNKEMPQEDAQRWNARYTETLEKRKHFTPRPFLYEHADFLPSKGLVLDIATGLGGNANFLISRGLKVVGIDISEVGLRASKARSPDLLGIVADLTHFYLPDQTFDVILNFFYLQRGMWPDLVRWLRPGGVLYFETMTERMLPDNPQINPAHLLQPGELAVDFPDLEILYYEEFTSEEDGCVMLATDRLIARKP
jgi:tellurite methyltransferase